MIFAALQRRRRDRYEDAVLSWLSLREAGVIDADAPWPFREADRQAMQSGSEGQPHA